MPHHTERERLLKNSFVYIKKPFFLHQRSQDLITCKAIYSVAEKQSCSCCLLPALTESRGYFIWARGYIKSPHSLELGMKRDEEALVILTIFTDRYPFMLPLLECLVEVTPAVTLSFHLLCLYFFFLFPLPPPVSILYSSNTEGLYQLRGSHCAPQSSIEGLEDAEVGAWLFVFLCRPTAVTKCCFYSITQFESLL